MSIKFIYTTFRINADDTATVLSQFEVTDDNAELLFEHTQKVLRAIGYTEHYLERRTFKRSIFVNGNSEVKLQLITR